MKQKVAALITSAGLLGSVTAWASDVEVSSTDRNTSRQASASQFAGTVTVRPLTTESSAKFAGAGEVSFAPGGRTAWHTHPAGQWLYITSGTGWVKQEGKMRKEVHSGDVVWIPAGVKHWHGATSTQPMSHIAITPMQDGKNVEWMDQVAEADYLNND